jgi:hypothetical protein
MRKAEIKLRRYIKNLKRSEDEAGYQCWMLIKQFTPDETLKQILDTEDLADIKSYDNNKAMRVITNASGFAIEKIFAKRDDMAMAGMLTKMPFVAQDPIRLSRLLYTIAKDYGSNWDKKIVGIVPTPEELQIEKQKAEQEKQNKKLSAIQQATTQALQSGASEEEAREVGLQAGKKFDALLDNQQMMAQQQQQKGE